MVGGCFVAYEQEHGHRHEQIMSKKWAEIEVAGMHRMHGFKYQDAVLLHIIALHGGGEN